MADPEDGTSTTLLLVTVGIAVFMTSLDLTMVAVSLPSIARDLGVSTGAISWVIMAFLLVPCSFLAAFVTQGERKGFRTIFAAGCLVFVAGSLLSGISASAEMLIGARLLQGLGASMSSGLAMAMVLATLPDPEHQRGLGIIALSASLGIALGPVLGDFITAFLSWHGIFFVNIPVGIAVFFLSLRAVPGNPRPGRREGDYRGGFLIFLAILGFVLFLSQGLVMGFTSSLVVVSLAVSILASALFIQRERSIPNPLFPPGLFRSRTFSLANLAALLVMLALAGALFILPFYLEYVRDLPPAAAGLVLTIPAAGMVIAGLLSRVLSIRAGPRGPSAFSAVVLCFGFLVMARAGVTGGEVFIYGGLVMIGLGAGGFVAANTVQVLSFSRPGETGPVSSLMLTIRILGLILGVAIFDAMVVAVVLSGLSGVPVTVTDVPSFLLLDAFRVAFLTGALVALLAFISVMATRKGRRGAGPVR